MFEVENCAVSVGAADVYSHSVHCWSKVGKFDAQEYAAILRFREVDRCTFANYSERRECSESDTDVLNTATTNQNQGKQRLHVGYIPSHKER